MIILVSTIPLAIFTCIYNILIFQFLISVVGTLKRLLHSRVYIPITLTETSRLKSPKVVNSVRGHIINSHEQKYIKSLMNLIIIKTEERSEIFVQS